MATQAGKAYVPFTGDFSSLTHDAEGAFANIASKFTTTLGPSFFKGVLGPSLVAGVALAVVGVGAEAAKMASQFQESLSQIAANADITATQATAIGDAFLSTAGDSTYSAQTIAAAYVPVVGQLKLVEGGALSAADSLLFMRDASDLAEATGAPLADTTAALAKVMQAYQLSVADASGASDILYNSSIGLNIPVAGLADTVDKLHAKLGPLAPTLSDVGTTLLDVASHGLTGNRALMLVSTGFGTLLSGAGANTEKLDKATTAYDDANSKLKALEGTQVKGKAAIAAHTKAVDAQKTAVDDAQKKVVALSKGVAGLNLTIYDGEGNFVGMKSIIEQLQPKLAGMTEEERLFAEKTLFGAGAGKALDDTIMAGLPGWDAAAKAADKTGTAHAGAVVATDNLQGSFDRLKGKAVDAGIAFGTKMMPVLKEGMDWASTTGVKALQDFGKWLNDSIIQPGVAIAKVVFPPVLDAFKFLSDHIWIVEGALAAIVVRWAIIKALGIYSAVLQMGASFVLAGAMAGEAGFAGTISNIASSISGKLLPNLGAAKIATSEMGAASSLAGGAAMGLMAGLVLLALAAAAVVFNVGGARDKLHDFLFTAGDVQGGVDKLKTSLGGSDFFTQWSGGSKKTLDEVAGNFQDHIGKMDTFRNRFFGDADRDLGNFKRAWEIGGAAGQAVLTQLANAGQWDEVQRYEKALADSGGDVTKALQTMANQGDTTAKALQQSLADAAEAAKQNAVKMAADAFYNFTDLQLQTKIATTNALADSLSSTQATYDAINAVYGASAKQYIDAWNITHPVEAEHMRQVQAIADAMHLSVADVEKLGTNSALTYGGITGTTAQVIANLDAINARTQTMQYYAALAAGSWDAAAVAAGKISQSVATINHNAAANAAGISLQGGAHAAGGKFFTPHWAQIAEGGETEWVIPAHNARGFESLLDALVGGSVGASPLLGADPASMSLRGGAGGSVATGTVASQPARAPNVITNHIAVTQNNPTPNEIARSLAWHMAGR